MIGPYHELVSPGPHIDLTKTSYVCPGDAPVNVPDVPENAGPIKEFVPKVPFS